MLKVPETMILKYISGDATALANYKKIRIDEFIFLNKQFRWCPSPGCSFAADYPNLGIKEIKCKCYFMFCFACGEEAHRPALCDVV
jgi:ariadne-1